MFLSLPSGERLFALEHDDPILFLLKLQHTTRFLQQQRQAITRQIEHRLDKEMRQAIALWDSIPGVDEDIATIMVAEMGICTEQFPDGPHAASWTCRSPIPVRA